MVLPELLLPALSRPGPSRQAGTRALPSLPWQAADKVQNMDQHNFFQYILTCEAVLERFRNNFWKRLQ